MNDEEQVVIHRLYQLFQLRQQIRRDDSNLDSTLNNFRNFLNNLDELKLILSAIDNDINYKKLKDTRIKNTNYNSLFNIVEGNITRMNNYKNKLNTISDLSSELITKTNDIINKCSEMGKSINKNKLKFGLQGDIRSIIDTKNISSDIPEGVRDVIMARNTVPGHNGGKNRNKLNTRKNNRRNNRKLK